MKWTSQVWMSTFIEFEMESDTQPTEREIIATYGNINLDDDEVVYTETIDQTDAHESEVQ